MKKACAVFPVMAAMLLLTAVAASAENGGFVVTAPGSVDEGRLFKVSVSSDVPIGAGEFFIEYDPLLADFREIKVVSDEDMAEISGENGALHAVIASAEERIGALFTLEFKALKSGDITFRISVMLSDEDQSEENAVLAAVEIRGKAVSGKAAGNQTGSSNSSGSKSRDNGEGSRQTSVASANETIASVTENVGQTDKLPVFLTVSEPQRRSRLMLGVILGACLAGAAVTVLSVQLFRKVKKGSETDHN